MAKKPLGGLNLKKFGNKIQLIRTKNVKITQLILAEAADISVRQVQRIEAGECDIYLSTALKISEALKVDLSELLK